MNKKLCIVSWGDDYGFLIFDDLYWGKTLKELRQEWTSEYDYLWSEVITLTVKSEDKWLHWMELYIKISNVDVTDEVKEAIGFLDNYEVVDYDYSKHKNFIFIKEG